MTEQEQYARTMRWCVRVLITCAVVLAVCAVQLAYLAFIHKAHAQGGPVQQSGPIVPGHIPVFVTNGVIGDGGSVISGQVKELGIVGPGIPFCILDAPMNGPHHRLCFGANSLDGGLITYNAYGGATPLPLRCEINGFVTLCLGGEETHPRHHRARAHGS